MSRRAGHVFTETRNINLKGFGTFPGLLRLTRGSTDPSLGSGDGDFLYSLNGNLVYEAAGTTTTLGAVGGVGTTWESLYANDTAWALNGAFTITQSTNNAFTLTKTGTGAGDVFTINNAGTGDDFAVVTTRAAATGIILDFHHDSASPADADVIFEMQINGEDDGSTKTEYGRIRFLSDDVTNATEDASFQLALFVAGTQSTCMQVVGPVVTIGDGTSNAILESSGALDLILRTNAGTDSGTIRIYDAANGNIEILPNGTGDLTVPTSGIVLGGTTPTRCTFNVAGSTGAGTTGQAVLINVTTLTTGTALEVDSASSSSGLLLDLQLANSSVFSVSETGATIIAGSAGNTVFTITAGDVLLSDASITLVDADNAATVSITNNTATTANTVLFTGSGVFTGTGTTAFFRITQSGATTGDVVNVQCDGLTSGTAVRIGSTGTIVTTGRVLEMIADSATTAAGLVELTADALTTGIGVLLTTTSVNLAAGQLLNIDHTASGTIVAKTGQLIDIVSSRNNTAAAAISDDYDALSILRTNINTDAGGTLNAAGACLYIENTGTQTAGTLADTVNGIELVMTGGTTQDGIGISLTHTGTTAGRAMLFTLSHTTLDGVIQVTANSVNSGNVIVADMNGLTSGIGLELTHTTSVITTGSVCRITSTGIDTGTGQGTLLDLVSSGATAATVVSLVSDALATGIAFSVSLDGLTTGEGFFIEHTTSVIADGGSLFRLRSTGIDTGGATNGTVFDIQSTAQTAGTVCLVTASALVGGTAFSIIANALTTGTILRLETSDAGFTSGFYLQCNNGAANVFIIGDEGATTIAGVAGSTVFTVTAGDISIADGSITLADNDNANTVSIVNDTATTIGAAANAGMVDISGDGLTTGTALNIGLTEGTLTTGRYLKCWDVTGAVEVAAIEEDGELFVAGGRATTAGGADAINIGASAALKIAWGSGAPTYTAPQGSLYLRTDGSSTSTRLYVNSDGAGTWVAVTTAS